jgi:hypothetical protein
MGPAETRNYLVIFGLLGGWEEVEIEGDCQDNGTEPQVLCFVSAFHPRTPLQTSIGMLIVLMIDREAQYKRQFGIWNLKRALSTTKKEKIIATLETRAQQGKSSLVKRQDKIEDPKVRRYMKEQARREISIWASGISESVGVENLSGHALQCGNRV